MSAEDRHHVGQVLLLSRTMLSNHGLPYVGRFACDWHRLATTDPHGRTGKCTPGGFRRSAPDHPDASSSWSSVSAGTGRGSFPTGAASPDNVKSPTRIRSNS